MIDWEFVWFYPRFFEIAVLQNFRHGEVGASGESGQRLGGRVSFRKDEKLQFLVLTRCL